MHTFGILALMRIAVVGPQNTGKSTFIQDFLKAFPQFSTPAESYRDVVRKHNLQINQLTGTEAQRHIREFMREQIGSAPDNTIFDRCLIDNYMYSRFGHAKGNVDEAFLKESRDIMRETAGQIDLYLFIPSALSIPLVNDALRDTDPAYVDTVNRMCTQIIMDLIREKGIDVEVIGGTREERIESVGEILRARGVLVEQNA